MWIYVDDVVKFYSRKRIDHTEGYVTEDAKDPVSGMCVAVPFDRACEGNKNANMQELWICMHACGGLHLAKF